MLSILFDMDDTLVATAGLWRRAEEFLLGSLGVERTEGLAMQYKGMNALDVAATIHQVIGPRDVTVEECQRRMRGALLENFRATPPGEMAGALACVERMAARTRVAVASGSPLEAIEMATRGLGMWGHFSEVVSSESVSRGKPEPDVFLEAARRLGVLPGECVVIEDSLIGVQAARAAGMFCFAVPSGNHAAIAREATRVFGSLAEIGWGDVEGLAR